MPVSAERLAEIRRQLWEHQQTALEMLRGGCSTEELERHTRATPFPTDEDERRALADSIRQEAEDQMRVAFGGQEEWDLATLISKTSSRANQESDRSIAIVLAAAVEERLRVALQRHLSMSKPGVAKRVRGMMDGANGGALGTFAAKVDLGMALGIFNGRVREALRNIAAVRNGFAHRLAVESFDHPDVAEPADKLGQFLKPHLDLDEGGLVKIVIRNGRNDIVVATGHRIDDNPLDNRRGRFQQACYLLLQLLFQAQPGVDEPDLHLT